MLEIGFSKVTITPPLGTPLGGYENRKYNATGIHDDVYARCMLFRDTESKTTIALIICDLLWVNYDFSDEIKSEIEKLTQGQVKAKNVIIHAIHVHSSQRIEGGLDFYYRKVKKGHNIDKGWYLKIGVPYLQRTIASSVYGALMDLKPAYIKGGGGFTDVGFNRREKDPAAQGVDHEIFGFFTLVEKGSLTASNIRAIFYNLAVHCVALGQSNYLISADWPFWTSERLKEQYQLPWNSQIIFGQGAAGNINPFNCKFGQEDRTLQDGADVGNRVADDLIKALDENNLQIIATPDQKCDLRHFTQEIYVEVKDMKKTLLYRLLNLWFIGVVKHHGKLALKIRIHLVKVNNLIIITTPGEPFGEFAIEIKKAVREFNKDYHPVFLELTDGAIAYITTRDSYYNGKGYEATLAGSPETGYEIVKTVKLMLNQIK
jgi:hypothetical protein